MDDRISSDIPSRLRQHLNERMVEIAAGFGTVSDPLGRAMSEAALASGKRFRGMLMLLAAEASGGADATVIDAACAVEMVHTASLIFDDMPCMDDARMRRGQPATHVAHGEGRAVLAGIALISEAIAVLAQARGAAEDTRARLVRILTRAIGPQGLCAGQDMDLHAGKDRAGVEREQDLKTGVLFVAAMEMLAAIRNVEASELDHMTAFARQLGRVFQSYDDLLDRVGDQQALGKDTGRDRTAPGPQRGLLAIGDFGQVSHHYEVNRARLDDLMRAHRFHSGEMAALLQRVLPYRVARSA